MKLKNLTAKILGSNYEFYPQIDSTQEELWRRVNNNKIKSGTLISADIQTAGIGTHGRKWYTKKNNIAFSFYLKLNCNISELSWVTSKIAELFVQIFKDKYNLNLDIKLPNDLYYNGKKVGGILTQTKSKGEIVEHVVIGIGINTSEEVFEEEISKIATSIKKEFSVEVDNELVIAEFCNRFEYEFEKRKIEL